MTKHRNNCIDCGGNGARIGWSDPFTLRECQSCGLVYYADWRTVLGDSDSATTSSEARYGQLEPAATQFNPVNMERLQEALPELARWAPTKRILDVGCGKGELVAAATSSGWDARGIDLAPSAIRIAQAHGLNCHHLDFFSSELDHERFGAICMSEFIEHVPTPTRFLQRAHELLADGGILYITTPNFKSLGRRIHGSDWEAFFVGHVSFWTSDKLKASARRVGFRVQRVRTGGVSVTAVKRLLGLGVGPVDSHAQGDAKQEMRELLYGSRTGRIAKRVLDPLIGVSGLGETLKATLVRPART